MDDRDLESLEGIRAYVEGELAEALDHCVRHRGEVAPLGVVIATRDVQGEPLNPPQPSIWGGYGDVRERVRTILRDKAQQLGAPGVIHVQQIDRQVVVRLEHRYHGDRVWRGVIHAGRFSGLGTMLDTEPGEQSRFLPERWAN